MKLYNKTKNIFLILSIITLFIALLFLFLYKNEPFGYFLLGLFATTLIITIQASMSAEVEKGKLLLSILSDMYDLCFDIKFFNYDSIEDHSMSFRDDFTECKESMEKLFHLNAEIAKIQDLDVKTKNEINVINNKIEELQLKSHRLLENFKASEMDIKVLYFIELYKIVEESEVDKIGELIAKLGIKLDSKKFFETDYSEKVEDKIQNLERKKSLKLYNAELMQKNAIEYKQLKDVFIRDVELKNFIDKNKRNNKS